MNWKKSLFMVMLAGMIALAVAGCQAEESVPAVEQPASVMGQPAPAPEGSMPTPSEGTMPAPPEGAAPGGRSPAPTIDLAAAAAGLGVTEQQLSDALGDSSEGLPDFAAAAAELGVSEETLREALGFPEGGPPAGGPPPSGSAPTAPAQ